MIIRNKFYVVWKGYKTGIFENWTDCKKQVHGFRGAEFKSFCSKEEATIAFEEYLASENESDIIQTSPLSVKSFLVNGNCYGNFGKMSYSWKVSVSPDFTNKKKSVITGTKNIADFIAIVNALKLSKKVKRNLPIFTTSKIALNWVKKKKCNHLLLPSKKTKDAFALIKESEDWLINNSIENEIILWNSVAWGKFPLNGRKRIGRERIRHINAQFGTS